MKKILGRIDKADFPLLQLYDIDIKIDTGAYTSSIHCGNVRHVKVNGKDAIKCNFLDPDHVQYHEKEFLFYDFEIKKVKSSNGQSEERYTVNTKIELFDTIFPIKLTLSERKEMRFPVLIGRKFLKNKFIVDVAVKNRSFKIRKRNL